MLNYVSFRQPNPDHSFSHSSQPSHLSSSYAPLSLLLLSITPTLFHSKLKRYLSTIDPILSFRLPLWTLDCSMVFFLVFSINLFSLIRTADWTDFLSVFDCTLNICILILLFSLYCRCLRDHEHDVCTWRFLEVAMVKLTAGLIVRSSSTIRFRNETVNHYLKRLTHVYLECKSLDEVVSSAVLFKIL